MLAAIFDETKTFLKFGWLLRRYTLWVIKAFEIALFSSFRDISTFVFCNFCKKFENLKWPPLLARQIFFEKSVS